MMGRERMSLGFGDDLDVADDAAGEGEGGLPALDLGAFQPRKRARVAAPELEATKQVAEAIGFRSREPKAAEAGGATTSGTGGAGEGAVRPAAPATKAKGTTPAKAPAKPEAVSPPPAEARPPVRRRRTGRNVQFNIKARPETIAAFTAIADANDWGFGETLEHAVALLEAHEKS